jgi:hypothetical protein
MKHPFGHARGLAAALLVAAFVVVGCTTEQGVASSPLASPSPTPSLSPTPTPAVSPATLPKEGTALVAGTYLVDDPFPVRIRFEVPRGWFSCGPGSLEVGVCADGIGALSFLIVRNVVAEPCDPSRAQLDPPVGPSVDDLVTAISKLPGFKATGAVDITLDGFHGKRFELTAPDGAGLCKLDDRGLGTWSTADRINGVGPGEVNRLQILDVDGTRLVISGAYHPGQTTADGLSELQQIIDSVHLAP